jgi:DNA polymerase-3 subunit delta
MKLSGREAGRYFARPDPARPAVLIFGADPLRVADRRRSLLAALTGPGAEAEMRLVRLSAADARRDPAALSDALKAQGFFPGPRAVHLEDATDPLAPAVSAALAGWRPGDAVLVVTAGQLGAGSALRKLFEGHAQALAVAVYDDPPGRDEIEAMLAGAGVARLDRGAMADLEALAQAVDPGDLRQTIEKLALYTWGRTGPVTSADLAACAPATTEAELDDALNAAAEGRTADLGPLLARLAGQGVAPVALAIAAGRHFRALHAVAADPGGPAQGIARLRPPVFGPRRDRMQRQAAAWGVARLEQALALILETDLALRSSARAPAAAVVERCLIRLSRLARA